MTRNGQGLLLAGILLFPAAAPRAAPDDPREAGLARARERAALVQSLPQGPAFASRGERYRIVGGLRAVLRPEAPGAGPAAADVVEEKDRFLVVREASGAVPAAPRASTAAGDLPVAVNTRTNAFGVVLGTVEVRLREPGAAAALARDHGLELVFAAPRMSMAFLRVPPGGDLMAAAARLAGDARVASAEIEVKERFDRPL